MIRTRTLEKRFSDQLVLRNLNLEIRAGERVALCGPNGAGKTTLLKILATLHHPTQGEAWIAGYSTTQNPIQARANLGWAPSTDQSFFPRLSGLENLLFFASLRQISQRDALQQIHEFPQFAPLLQALKCPFHTCSSGMRQALVLARACLGNPAVLLLDEPTRSLDRETTKEVHRFLARWSENKERTLLLATHSDQEAHELCTRQITLGLRGLEISP